MTCSDASETGGAAAAAFMLSWSGQSLAARLSDHRMEPVPCDILVISLFNGIGGSFRVYDLLGIKVLGRISIDICKESNRVSRSTWPSTLELHDVEHITYADVKGWANTYGRARQVHLWGGFPCIHLSSVRAFRRNLSGEGSRLFWALLDILAMVQDVFHSFATSNSALRMLPAWTKAPVVPFPNTWRWSPLSWIQLTAWITIDLGSHGVQNLFTLWKVWS